MTDLSPWGEWDRATPAGATAAPGGRPGRGRQAAHVWSQSQLVKGVPTWQEGSADSRLVTWRGLVKGNTGRILRLISHGQREHTRKGPTGSLGVLGSPG